MNHFRNYKSGIAAFLATVYSFFIVTTSGYAAVTLGDYQGTVSVEQNGSITNITASDQAILNFTEFNISQGETVNFIMSGIDATVLSRVLQGSASQILGELCANGNLILINEHGFFIGETATINAGGLMLSTLNLTNQDFLAGNYIFTKNVDLSREFASIINNGVINVREGGFAILISSAIQNNGKIMAPLGNIALATGDVVAVGISPDNRVSVEVQKPVSGEVYDAQGNKISDQISNTGVLAADGGYILLNAQSLEDLFHQAINLEGVVRADSVINRNGVIEIVSSKDINSKADISAKGGTVVLTAEGDIKSLGSLTANELIESGASFLTGGEFHVNSSHITNLDNAITLGTGNYSGTIADAVNIIIDTNAVITLTGNTTFLADSDFNGTGAFTMNAGSSIDGAGRDLTLSTSENSTLRTITNTRDLTFAKSAAGSTPTYTLMNDISGQRHINVNSGLTVDLGANRTVGSEAQAGLFTNNGTVNAQGNWTYIGRSSNSNNGTAGIVNNGTINHTGTGWNIDSSLTNNGTINYAGTAITLENNFTQNGTFDLTGKTVTLDNTGNDNSALAGNFNNATFVLNKQTNTGNVTNNTTINLGNNPNSTVEVGLFTNNGTVNLSGNWKYDASSNNSNVGTAGIVNNGTINHTGTGLDINSSLTNNGTINYAGTAMTIENNFAQNGTFDLTGKTVTVDNTSGDDTTLSGNFNNATFVINKNTHAAFVTNNSTINLGNNPTTMVEYGLFTNNGTVNTSGNWTYNSNTAYANNGTAGIVNNGTINHTGTGWDINSSLTNGATGTINYAGTAMTVENNFAQNGTFDLTGKTVTLDNSSTDSSTLSGNFNNATFVLNKVDHTASVTNNTSINLGNNPTSTVEHGLFTNNGTVDVQGNWRYDASNAASNGNGAGIVNNGTINHTGTGWDINSSLTNSATGTINYAGTAITLENNITQNGTFDLTGKTITLDNVGADNSIISGDFNNGVFVLNKANSGAHVTNNADINLGNNATSLVEYGVFTNNGVVNAQGNWTYNASSGYSNLITGSSYQAGIVNNGTINHTGTGWDINSSLANNAGGTINYAGTAMSVENHFKQNGTFDLTGKTITFDTQSNGGDNTIVEGNLNNAIVVVNKANTSGGAHFTNNTTIDLGNNATSTTNFGLFTNNGTVNAQGNWTYNTNSLQANTNSAGFVNNGTVNHTGTGWDLNTSFTNNAGGTINYAGTDMNVENNFAQNGTFDLTGKTVTFDSTTGDRTTIEGDLNNGIVAFNKTSLSGNGFITNNTTINLGNNPTSTLLVALFTNNGTVNAQGTWTYNAHSGYSAVGVAGIVNNGTINHTGGVWDINTSLTNNAGATINFSGTDILLENNMTLDGTLNAPNLQTLTLDGTQTADDTILNSTIPIPANLVINKTVAAAQVTLATDITVLGDFSRLDGGFITDGNPRTVNLQGDFLLANTDAFGGTDMTMNLTGGNNQTLSRTAGTFAADLNVNKTGGTASLLTAFTVAGDTNIQNGTLDLNGNNFTSTGAFNVDGAGAVLELFGSELSSAPTFTNGSTARFTGDGDGVADVYNMTALTNSYQNLEVSSTDGGTDTFNFGADTDVNQNFTINAGVVNDLGNIVNIGGDWTNAGGTFNGIGTTIFDGGNQTLRGNNTFGTLRKNTPGTTFTLGANDIQTVNTLLDLNGGPGSLINLRSTTPGTQAVLLVDAANSVTTFLDVQDNNHVNITTPGQFMNCVSCVDSGNTSLWFPPPVPPGFGTTLFGAEVDNLLTNTEEEVEEDEPVTNVPEWAYEFARTGIPEATQAVLAGSTVQLI